MLHRLRTAELLGLTACATAALAILLGLGAWQWNRMAWKQDLVATISARVKASPLNTRAFSELKCEPLEQVGLAKSCEYTPVQLTGRYDHNNERHVYTSIDRTANGGKGGQGYWIVTPFQIAVTEEIVAVSRGFIPDTSMDIAIRKKTWIEGETTISGLVRSAEPRMTFTNANDPKKNTWYLRNARELYSGDLGAAMARRDIFIDLVAPTAVGDLPQPTAGRIDIPNRHFEYALTWWALAATLLAVFGVFAGGRMREVKAASTASC